MSLICGGTVVSGEFQSVAGKGLRTSDCVRLVVRRNAHAMPARAGLERAGQHIRPALAVQIDGLVVVGIPHPQSRAIELHARVRGLGALEDGARKDVALELACRHLVRRDAARRDLHRSDGVRCELVRGDRAGHYLVGVNAVGGQLVGVNAVRGQFVGRDSTSHDVTSIDLVRVEQRDRHILRDLELRGRDRVRGQLVGADGTGLHLTRRHRVRGQFVGVNRVRGDFVGRDSTSHDVTSMNLMDIQERHGHILGDLELARGHRIGRELVSGDGERDDVARLHAVGCEFRGGHRVGNQLFSRDRIGRELVHCDGIGLDLFGGHGIHGEMLRGHGTRRENVVRYEVKRLEARAIPRQDFDDAICEGHQHAWRSVRSAEPVRVKVSKHRRRIILLTLPASPILLGAPPHVARLQPIMRGFVRATVDQILAIRSGLRLFRGGLRLIRLSGGVRGGGRSLVSGGLSGFGRIIRLDGGVRRIGSGLVRHRRPCAAVPPFRRVSAIRGVDPQGSRLAHRRGRRSGLDQHVGLAVRHASGGSSSRIRLPCGGGRVGGGLGRTVGGGLRLRRHA